MVLGGMLIGLGARYILPGRAVLGIAVLPAAGGATSAAVWAVLTWSGWPYDGTWIWVATFLIGAAAVTGTAFSFSRRRTEADERMLETLSRV